MKRNLKLEDLYKLSYVSDPHISPNGETVAFVKTVPSKAQNSYSSSVWLVAKGKEAVCLSKDYTNARLPRWSPDGETILFIANVDGQWVVKPLRN